nr:hypothetical protein [Tanacetum cinerariifolium]
LSHKLRNIPTPSHNPLPNGEDRMQLSELIEICKKLSDMVFFLEQIKTNQAAKIKKLKKKVKMLEGKKKKRTHGLKRLYKFGLTARVESFEKEEDHGRMNDEDLFGVNDLDGDEVIVDIIAGENVKQDTTVAKKEVSAAADEVVTTVESVEDSTKRAGDEIEQESAKRQRLEKEDDTAELKRCLEIVLEDDDVTIEATPLSSKSSTIVDYKIYKEGQKSYFKIIKADGNKSYFKIIKADGNVQNYLTFGTMFDLEVLRSIVKERFKKINPVKDMDNLLFQTLKTMFKHHVKDNLWKYQQGVVKVRNWKLYDSRGVYCVTT